MRDRGALFDPTSERSAVLRIRLAGEHFTVADIACFTNARCAEHS